AHELERSLGLLSADLEDVAIVERWQMAGHDEDRDFRAEAGKARNSSSAPQGFVVWVWCYDNEFLWRHHERPIVSQPYAKNARPVCNAARSGSCRPAKGRS